MPAVTAPIAQYAGNYNEQMDGSWGWGMMSVMIIALLLVVVLVVWMARTTPTTHVHTTGPAIATETPAQILERRLAAGELTPDEYHDRAAILAQK